MKYTYAENGAIQRDGETVLTVLVSHKERGFGQWVCDALNAADKFDQMADRIWIEVENAYDKEYNRSGSYRQAAEAAVQNLYRQAAGAAVKKMDE